VAGGDGLSDRGRSPTFFDLVADYQSTYGHRPDPTMPWPEFVGLVRRIAQHSARDFLTASDSVALAIATALGGGQEAKTARKQLELVAFPDDPEDVQRRIEHLKAMEEADNGA